MLELDQGVLVHRDELLEHDGQFEWRQQISRHIKWLRAQGAEADKAAYAVYEAGQKRQEEKARQREVLLSQIPDEETGQQ